jgi:hypothetical protein
MGCSLQKLLPRGPRPSFKLQASRDPLRYPHGAHDPYDPYNPHDPRTRLPAGSTAAAAG